jgi:hypothetical protein
VGFLRKDAYLAVIFLTDEDDCSAPTNSDLFGASMDTTGVASSLRCSIQGHVCGTAHPTATNGYSQNLSDCRPAQDGKLIGISDFVDFFIGLKDGRREKVVVSAIAGWPTGDASTAKYEYKNVPDGNMVELRESPTCTYGGGGAAAGIRMKTFVESFGENGYFTTICQEDFRAAMGKIGRILAARLQNRCVAGPLADSDPTKQGLQPDCRVVVRTPSGNNAWMERVLQNCDKSAPPCWKLVPTPANGEEVCEHGFKIDVERNGAMPPPDTQDVIKCLTEAGKL